MPVSCPRRSSWPFPTGCNGLVFRGFVLRQYLPKPGVARPSRSGGASLSTQMRLPVRLPAGRASRTGGAWGDEDGTLAFANRQQLERSK